MLIDEVAEPFIPELRNEYIDLYNSLFPEDQKGYDCKKCGSEVFNKLIWLKNKSMAKEESAGKKYRLKKEHENDGFISRSLNIHLERMGDITDEQIAKLIESNKGNLIYFEEVK